MKYLKITVNIIWLILLMAAFAIIQPVQAGDDEWTTTTLASLGINDIAAEPTNPNVIYAATDNGLLASWDGGHNWRVLNNTTNGVQAILVHPQEATHLYAAINRELQKSEDGGQTWTTIGSGVVNSPYWLGLHPAQPEVIYVMANGGLFRSKDAGSTWSSAGVPVTGAVQAMAFHPDNPDLIFVAANDGRSLFRTEDGGQSWLQISDQMNYISVLNMTPSGKLFVQDWNGILRSEDNGESWLSVNPEDYRRGFVQESLVVDAIKPETLYVGSENGISRSDDGGATWMQFANVFPNWPERLLSDNTTEGRLYAITNNRLYITVDGGATWRGAEANYIGGMIQAHPAQSGLLFNYSSRESPLRRSQDGGQTWQDSSTGLENVRVSKLFFDPTNTNTIYAGTNGGLFLSEDNGSKWAITGLPNNVQVLSIAVDPKNNANLFVGGSNDLLRSNNNGESWTAVSLGRDVVSLAIDSQDPQRMYAIANNQLHRSTDGGINWAQLNYPGRGAVSLAVKPDDAGTLYVTDYRNLYISRDGGGSFTPVSTLPEADFYNASSFLQTDSKRPEALYLAVGRLVFISPDAGANWYPLSKGAPNLTITSLTVDASEQLTLYSSYNNATGGIWRYTMSQLPQPPTPTPTATNTPTPVMIATPTPQSPDATLAPGQSRIAATATAIAAGRTQAEATAVAVFGLDETETTPVNEIQPDTDAESSGPSWFLILGGLLLLIVLAGGGFYWWQRQPVKTAVTAPAPPTRLCPNCGANLPAQAKFCIKCGQSLQGN